MIRDVKEIITTMQEVMPRCSGVEKVKGYYDVLSELNNTEFAIWVLRNHRNSLLLLQTVESKLNSTLHLSEEKFVLKPNKRPMSFKNIGCLLGVSEKKARSLYEDISCKVIAKSTIQIEYYGSIHKSLEDSCTLA